MVRQRICISRNLMCDEDIRRLGESSMDNDEWLQRESRRTAALLQSESAGHGSSNNPPSGIFIIHFNGL
uniref:Uncharacterized protein n=1 Tax=Parascaris equorum TaxID=6256 RepID=A0A914R1I8_PAREQ